MFFSSFFIFFAKISVCTSPGGVGTFDEIWDSVCGKSLGMKGMKFKPICLINTDGFYDGFVVQMDRSQKEGCRRNLAIVWIFSSASY